MSFVDVLSSSWKDYIKDIIDAYYHKLILQYNDYSDFIVCDVKKIDDVFDFYAQKILPAIRNIMQPHPCKPKSDNNEKPRIDRHKILSGYALSMLVENNHILRFDERKYTDSELAKKNISNNIGVPFFVAAPMENVIANLIPAFLVEFMKKESTHFDKVKLPGYNLYYPNNIPEYKDPISQEEQKYNDFYFSFVKLLVVIRKDIERLAKNGQAFDSCYPICSMIMALSSTLFLIESVSDCGVYSYFNLNKQYYKEETIYRKS
jgi:hypothetical protein